MVLLKNINQGVIRMLNQSEKLTSYRLIPVPLWNKYHEWPSVAGLRYLIFNENTNGFNTVVKRVGRRVLIDERAFFQWIDKNNPQQTTKDEPNITV